MSDFNDIKDSEIRILGNANQSSKPPRKPIWSRWLLWTICILVLLILAIVVFYVLKGGSRPKHTDTEAVVIESAPVAPTVMKSETATVLFCDTVINDVPLRVLTPVNAVPELMLGIPDTTDESLVLGLRAADIRADNGGIVGAFVLKGEMLSRGVTKKGFCAIIDGEVQLGMAQSTPLFEETTAMDGYFFRQYPLVHNGRMVENKPKNKAVRHALCELEGRVVVVSSLDNESLHDFAQSLEDLGVQNAISLSGADAYGFARAQDSGFHSWGADQERWKDSESVNFILWRANNQ
jgi:hypothetical protein